jgi:NAD(P)H-hydrate epimerase
MKPVLTADEMRAADHEAMRTVTHAALVERAGLAAAIAAARLLPRVYGARIAVLCGPGSNGADGRVAARHLADRGAAVTMLDVDSMPARVDGADLVVDAAFGTGLTRRWDAPEVGTGVPVLAVDLTSGVDPDTGIAVGRSLRATRTIAMGALKRGHLLADGATLSGEVEVAALGIEATDPTACVLEDADVCQIEPLGRTEHKWRRAVVVVAGSPGILGAAALACEGATSVQAGMVLLYAPDVPRRREGPWPTEVVRLTAGANDQDKVVLDALDRAHALVVGPGLGRSARLQRTVAELLAAATTPVVLDADALHLVDPDLLLARQRQGGSPIVLTPHDGEYTALFGRAPGTDRFAAALDAATRTGCIVLLKGATTVVASTSPPEGTPRLVAVTSGTPDLASPGTGDVLSGVIGGLLARGLPAQLAAAIGAHLHGRAGASLGPRCRAGLLAASVTDVLGLLEGRSGGHRGD